MSNVSLKEQLQAVAARISEKGSDKEKRIPASPPREKALPPQQKIKKQKPEWLDYVQYGVELLKVYFPHCFKSIKEVQPLKKGVKEDLLRKLSTMADITTEDKACMVKSLTYYVNTLSYHKSVIEGASRINLQGEVEGVVSAEEAQYSIQRCQAKLQAKQNNQSKQKVPQKDNPAG